MTRLAPVATCAARSLQKTEWEISAATEGTILTPIPLPGLDPTVTMVGMPLSDTTLARLSDEAYAFLTEQALLGQLETLERKRQEVRLARPRFGVLSRRETRESFAQSMQELDEAEAELRLRLSQIDGINRCLLPLMREEVSTYLADESADYCGVLQVYARLGDWENAWRHLPDLVKAFTRDLRELRTVATASQQTQEPCLQEIAVLRESADNLARLQFEFSIIEQATLTAPPAVLQGQLHFPALPDLKRTPWVTRLATLPPSAVIEEAAKVEAEFRAFLAEPEPVRCAPLQASRELCARVANELLDNYWNVLREHARMHYVEERGLDEVIAMLSERYIDADIERRQQDLTIAPFQIR